MPALITVVALLLVAFNHAQQLREYRVLVEEEQSLSLIERLGVEQSRIEQQIEQGNSLQLRRMVAELGLRPHLTHAYLTAPGDVIVGSLARADVGRPLADALAEDARAGVALSGVEQTQDRPLHVEVDAGRTALIGVLSLGSGYRLLVRSDLALPLAQRLHRSRAELWRHAATILCSAFALSVFLHLIWFRRAARLTEAARAFGRGRLDTRVSLGGSDELAEIGAAFNDMAERLQGQHMALRDSERHFRAMFEQAAVGVARIDTRAGHFVEINRKYCDIVGYSADEMHALDFMRITHPDDLAADLRQMEALRTGQIREFSMEKRLFHKDGRTLWVTLSVSPLWLPGDEPDFHIAVIQDITASRESEQALRLERNRLQEAERIARLGSWEFYPALGRRWWSRQMFDFFAMDPDRGMPDNETYLAHIHPDDRQRMREVLARMGDSNIDAVGVFRTDPALGPVRHLQPSIRRVADAPGGLVKYAGTLLDVSDVVAAERALRESEERLRATLEQAPNVAVQWFDAAGRVLYWNCASTRLYGWSPDEAMGRTAAQLMLLDDDADRFARVLAGIERTGASAGPSEYRVRTRSGEQKHVESATFSIPGARDEHIFVCMDVDVTARRQAEQAVEKERTHLQTLFASLPDMVWLKSPEGVYLSCNRMFERLAGLREAELLGKTDYDLFPKETADYFRAHDERAIRAGCRSINDEWVTLADTGEHLLLQTIKTPMRSAAGELIGVLGIARDITELRGMQDSLSRLNQELEQRVADRTQALSEAIKELESFSYAVSHDLKAPLRGIDGYSKILLEDYGDRLDETAQRFLNNIRNGAGQMHALIEDLLAYSRMERRSIESSRVDLGEVMQGLLARRADELAALSASVVGKVPSIVVRADRQGVEMVLRNLLDNALKFSRDARPPIITLEAKVEQGRVLLSVRDNGIGFDMKYHERIFEIFQRLHRSEDFAGTGVGLALVRKAMQRMGGRVWADSVPGEGACFHLEFPA
ncbi:MAG TPA: PAS domain S-box protein [Methyloversatilis sp.]